jgi:hypothetical protein
MVPVLLGTTVMVGGSAPAYAGTVTTFTSSWTADNGGVFAATNHLVEIPGVTSGLIENLSNLTGGQQELPADVADIAGLSESVPAGTNQTPHEYLIVWAGDVNAADLNTGHGTELRNLPGFVGDTAGEVAQSPVSPAVGPDFLAVVDAQQGSPSYGQVINTVTVPLVENEPHHMQYIWHQGETIFAGGLYSDFAYALDVTNLPLMTLKGVNQPLDTPCGSVPDAFWVLNDGTAYGTWMGGPDLPGPCTYTNGETRMGNGFAGTPGSLVRLDENGRTLAEVPAATPGREPAPQECHQVPQVSTSCANPHGIQVREDLNRMVTSDFAEPRDIIEDPLPSLDGSVDVARRTVRIWDISDRNNPQVTSVARMPDGPRPTPSPAHEENVGMMEATVTNLPQHKGAFAESMCGSAIFYTPDITTPDPQWREVFDGTAAAMRIDPETARYRGGGCDGGGWVQTALDDRFLYHVVMGRRSGSNGPRDPGTQGMLYALDIQKLMAAGTDYNCNIDTKEEAFRGGDEADCPTIVDVLPIDDPTTGGPHWGALDNFAQNPDGTFSETTDIDRIAVANYFVARTGWDGNHKMCMANIGPQHELMLDTTFRDEVTGEPCVDFNRLAWPHGPWGNAKPHSMVFAAAESAIR